MLLLLKMLDCCVVRLVLLAAPWGLRLLQWWRRACIVFVLSDPARADNILEIDVHPTVAIVEMTIVRLPGLDLHQLETERKKEKHRE